MIAGSAVPLLIATDVHVSGWSMLIVIELGLEQVLDLICSGIELHPLLVGRLRDTMSLNTRGLKPPTNSID